MSILKVNEVQNTSGTKILTQGVSRTTEAGAISGGTNYDFTLPSNCFRVDFVGHNQQVALDRQPSEWELRQGFLVVVDLIPIVKVEQVIIMNQVKIR
jgi:hypothetical protein